MPRDYMPDARKIELVDDGASFDSHRPIIARIETQR